MVENSEASALLDVQHRLERTFPNVASTVVRQVVVESYGAMTGPIRDFVPLLVEHQARDALASSVRTGGPTVGG